MDRLRSDCRIRFGIPSIYVCIQRTNSGEIAFITTKHLSVAFDIVSFEVSRYLGLNQSLVGTH